MSAASAPQRLPTVWVTARHHLSRAFGSEPNPLCRRVDRSRSRLLVALALVFVTALAAAAVVGLAVLRAEQAGARQVTPHRHQVTATTVSAMAVDTTATRVRTRAQAVWDYPPIGRNGGFIAVPPSTVAGSSVRIWVDDHGDVASAPPGETAMATNAAFAGLGALAVAALAAEAGYTARRRLLDRRAERDWEPEWEQVEPLWSGRRHPESGQP